MKVVVLNAGSGSQRCSLFDLPPGAPPDGPLEPQWEAKIDATAPGQPAGRLLVRLYSDQEKRPMGEMAAASTIAERTEKLLQLLWSGPAAPLRDAGAITAVGHRVVHGGDAFLDSVRIDERVEQTIAGLAAFAPLHNSNNLTGIRVARSLLPAAIPQIAVFDTSFHRTLSEAARTYAGPFAWREQGIRRYGFHGTSFRWASARAARLLRRENDPGLRLILCHIAGGCSLCATVGGRSIDTTMGLTPLEGIAMCTRSGSIDPGILFYLLRQGTSVEELEHTLNKHSGLTGLSGLAGDTRIIGPAARAGNARAQLAWDVFIHRLRAGIGQMLASLGAAPHALVFTDVIGESEPALRADACAAFSHLDLHLDEEKNARSPSDADIATAASATRVLIVKAREAWQIALDCHRLTSSGSDVAPPRVPGRT